jgi:hypothetical protein
VSTNPLDQLIERYTALLESEEAQNLELEGASIIRGVLRKLRASATAEQLEEERDINQQHMDSAYFRSVRWIWDEAIAALSQAALSEENQRLKKQLQFVREQRRLLERELRCIAMACEITRRDLQRKISWQPGCAETGSEQVERFERGINAALRRLEEVRDSHEGLNPIDWGQALWREGTGE